MMRRPEGGSNAGARKLIAFLVLAGAMSRLPGYLANEGSPDGKAMVILVAAVFAALVIAYGFWPVRANG